MASLRVSRGFAFASFTAAVFAILLQSTLPVPVGAEKCAASFKAAYSHISNYAPKAAKLYDSTGAQKGIVDWCRAMKGGITVLIPVDGAFNGAFPADANTTYLRKILLTMTLPKLFSLPELLKIPAGNEVVAASGAKIYAQGKSMFKTRHMKGSVSIFKGVALDDKIAYYLSTGLIIPDTFRNR